MRLNFSGPIELADGLDGCVVGGFELGLGRGVFDGREDGGDVFGVEVGEAADRAVANFDGRLGERELQVGFDLLQGEWHVAGELGVRLYTRFERRVLAGDINIGVERIGVPEGRGVGLVGDFEPEEVAVDLRD